MTNRNHQQLEVIKNNLSMERVRISGLIELQESVHMASADNLKYHTSIEERRKSGEGGLSEDEIGAETDRIKIEMMYFDIKLASLLTAAGYQQITEETIFFN